MMRVDGDDPATPGLGVECAINVAIACSFPRYEVKRELNIDEIL